MGDCVIINLLNCTVDAPSQPRDLTVTEYSKDFIVICWSEPEINGGSEIIQYVVEKCDVTRGSRTWVVAGTVGPSEKTFTASRLFQGNLYLFRVVAENQVGPGPAVELAEPVMAKLPYGMLLSVCLIILCTPISCRASAC